MDIFYRLRQFDIFSHFSDPQIDQIWSCTSQVHHPKDTTVIREGDKSLDPYLVDTGKVRIQRNTHYGTYVLAELTAGDLFGETSFIDGYARSSDALVVAAASLFPLNATALHKLIESDTRFALALYWSFWKSLSQKLRHTTERLAQFPDFGHGGGASAEVEVPKSGNGSIRVGITAKRDLFREQKLSQLEINFLASLSQERSLAPGEIIFREGDEGDALYVVLDGRVMISKQIAGAGDEALEFVERGGYFGEMALIDNEPRSADVKADESGAVVLAIPRKVLEGILDIQKVSSIRLLRLLCNLVARRLRNVDDKLVGWFIFSGGTGSSLEAPP